MAHSSWQPTRAEHKGSLCAEACTARHPQELGTGHRQGTGHSRKTELLWVGRRAESREEAAVGTTVPRHRRGGRGCRDWDGNRGGSQHHSLAFAGMSSWLLKGNIQISNIMPGIYLNNISETPGVLEILNETSLHFSTVLSSTCCEIKAGAALLSAAKPPPRFPHSTLFLCTCQIFISWIPFVFEIVEVIVVSCKLC